jgi:hypothetical protein
MLRKIARNSGIGRSNTILRLMIPPWRPAPMARRLPDCPHRTDDTDHGGAKSIAMPERHR